MPIEFLELDVIKNGCLFLNLYDCILKGSELTLNQELKVKYLSLSGCNIKEQVLETFLASCHFLEKLSLEGLTLNQNMINSICFQNGKALKVLNLHRTRGLDLESIETITNNLQGISHNFADPIWFLVNKSIQKIWQYGRKSIREKKYFLGGHTLITLARFWLFLTN